MTTIRPITKQDEARWRELWKGYQKFYRAEVPDAITAKTFAKFLNPDSGMASLVAERDGKVIGFCNYHFHQSTWNDKPYCYLEDLYVDPGARGSGAAKQLILACQDAAQKAGAARLYWQTQEFNAAARSLYDTITPRSSFIVYRIKL